MWRQLSDKPVAGAMAESGRPKIRMPGGRWNRVDVQRIAGRDLRTHEHRERARRAADGTSATKSSRPDQLEKNTALTAPFGPASELGRDRERKTLTPTDSL